MDVMGRDSDSEQYNYFQRLVARAFLAARRHADAITTLVHALADSGLDCYSFPDTLEKVWRVVAGGTLEVWLLTPGCTCVVPTQIEGRFGVGKSERTAAKDMTDVVLDACNKLTTQIYDEIQAYQNDIARDAMPTVAIFGV